MAATLGRCIGHTSHKMSSACSPSFFDRTQNGQATCDGELPATFDGPHNVRTFAQSEYSPKKILRPCNLLATVMGITIPDKSL
jgi:hypothetical protein